MNTVITDQKDRIIFSLNDEGKFAIGRYQDMSDDCKQYILDVYQELINKDIKNIRRFLNYENDEELCS